MELRKLKSALLATTAMAALMITGCGDDDGPDSPLGPSSIETATAPTMIGANSPAGAAMAGAAGAAPSANFVSEPTNTLDADVGDPNGSGLEIDGELPPGISRADLEARLADLQETFESEWTIQDAVVRQSNHGATRPGMHRITGYSVQKSGNRYEVELTLEVPNPPGNSDSSLLIERQRADGRFERVGTTTVGARLVNWGASAVVHNGTTHRFEPGWYVFWLSAQNCVNGHCAFSRPSVKVIEIEEEVEEEEGPPGPPTLAAWSTDLWACTNTQCVASGSVSLRNVVRSIFDVQIRGRLSFRDEPGAAFDQTINIPIVPQDGEVGFTFPTPLRQGRYLVELRQRRAPDGPWSNWKARASRMQVEPTASELAQGELPGAPRNVILDNVGSNRWKISWDPPSNPGGWQVRDYRIGDTGSTPPYYSRVCKGSGWPFRTARHHSTGEGDDEREFGYTLAVNLPEDWTISVSAVNARGEGDCTAAPVPD